MELALADEEWRKKSNRSIADYLGVSDPFVAEIRKEVLTVSTSQPATRTGKDGKSYPATQPAKPAPEPPRTVTDEVEDDPGYFDSDDDMVADGKESASNTPELITVISSTNLR